MNENQEQVSWNFAAFLNEELSRLRSQANKSFSTRNIPLACECLIAIRHSIVQTIHKDQLKEFMDIEDKILKAIGTLQKEVKGFGSPTNSSEKSKVWKELYDHYNTYNNKLQLALDAAGFLGARKADASKLKLD